MSELTVSVSQITPLLERLLDNHKAEVISPLVLIRGELEADTDPTVTVNGQAIDLVASASPLEIRAAAVANRDRPLAVVTPCDQSALGLDLIARSLGRKVRAVDRWKTVAGLFGAEVPSKQLARHRQLADFLIEESALGHTFTPVRSHVLDHDTAIAAASRALIDREPETLLDLVVWAESPQAAAIMRRLDGKDEVLQQLQAYHVAELGAGAAVVHAALRHRFDHPLTGAALAAQALLDQPEPPQPAVRSIENLFGNPHLSIEAYKHLGAVAVERARGEASGPEVGRWIATADSLFESWGWEQEAWRSPVSREGFKQRLRHAAEALSAWREQPSDRSLETDAEAAIDRVAEHRESVTTFDPRRLGRLRMTARIIRRGGFKLDEPGTLSAALTNYRRDGAWLDRARGLLAQDDEAPELQQLYRALTEEADNTRDGQSQALGRVLTQAAMPATDGVIGIEDAIDKVIAPLAETVPVLVAVLDGMSWPSFLDVDRTLSRNGWVPMVDAEGRASQSVIAVLPTVTEFSRTSLFSGELIDGDARKESRRFAAHRALQSVSHKDHPPVIFHKKSLASDGGIDSLPREAREAIGDQNQRVVAVVINNIDERLKEVANPLSGWDLDALTPLGSLLEQAREAGRAVVLTADHGHILERKTQYQAGAGGERWRKPGNTPPGEDEIEVSGPRVLGGDGTIVMPVVEQVRYSNARRHGYHGGLTLPEVAVPLAVYSAELDGIAGWQPTTFAPPAWWHPSPEGDQAEATPPVAAPVRASKKTKKPSPDQAQLFETDEPAGTDESTSGSSIERLMAEANLMDRIKKNRLDPEQTARTLAQLDLYGSTAVGLDRLADQLGYPRMRIGRLLTQIQRAVNIDGAAVLEMPNNEARFDRALLERQLGLT